MFERDYQGHVSEMHPGAATLTVVAIIVGILLPMVLVGKWILLNVDPWTATKYGIGAAWAWFSYVGLQFFRSRRRWKIQQVKNKMNEAK